MGQEVSDVIHSAQARAGYHRQTKKMCGMMRIEPRTFSNRMATPGNIKLSELKRMDRVLNFTDAEIVQIVRG